MVNRMNTLSHSVRIDTHRVALMDVEAESCAPEGGRIDLPQPTYKPQRKSIGAFWIVVSVSLASAAILLGLHLGARFHP